MTHGISHGDCPDPTQQAASCTPYLTYSMRPSAFTHSTPPQQIRINMLASTVVIWGRQKHGPCTRHHVAPQAPKERDKNRHKTESAVYVMVLTLTLVCHDSEKNASRYYCVDMVEGGLLGHTRDTETLAFANDPKSTQQAARNTQHGALC